MKKLLLSLFISGLYFTAQATHLRAGEIIARRVNCSSLTFKIIVRVYTDTDSPVQFGGPTADGLDVLDFGDGTKFIIPETSSIPLPGFNNVGVAEFTIDHTYPNPGTFIISYREPNRSPYVLNMINSVETTFYTETQIIIDPALGCYDYGHNFLATPIFTIAAGSPTTISLIATSNNAVFNIYNLVACQQSRNTIVNGYDFPETASIDPYTGLFRWDGRFNGTFTNGEFNFAVMVSQYIRVDNEVKKIGYTVRDFQIIVTEGPSTGSIIDNVVLNENKGITVDPQSTKQFRIFTETTEGTIQSITLFSEVPDFVSMQQYDSTNGAKKIKVAKMTFSNDASIVRDAPYAVTVRVAFSLPFIKQVIDKSYLFFTKDTNFPNVDLVTSVTEPQVFPLPYPNPTSGRINIVCLYGSYTIYNAEGREVMRGFADQEIDVSTLRTGMYYIVCAQKTNSIPIVHRFIKN